MCWTGPSPLPDDSGRRLVRLVTTRNASESGTTARLDFETVGARWVLSSGSGATSKGAPSSPDDPATAAAPIDGLRTSALREVAHDDDCHAGALRHVREGIEGTAHVLVPVGVDARGKVGHEGLDDDESHGAALDNLLDEGDVRRDLRRTICPVGRPHFCSCPSDRKGRKLGRADRQGTNHGVVSVVALIASVALNGTGLQGWSPTPRRR